MGQAKNRGSYEDRVKQATTGTQGKIIQTYNVNANFFHQMHSRFNTDPVELTYEQTDQSGYFQCFPNSVRYRAKHGGELVCGWCIMPTYDNEMGIQYTDIGIVELHQHVAVKKGDKIICTTPYTDNDSRDPIDFTRYFWQAPEVQHHRQDNLLWIPDTAKGRQYVATYEDIKHIQPGVLDHLDSSAYDGYHTQFTQAPFSEEAAKIILREVA